MYPYSVAAVFVVVLLERPHSDRARWIRTDSRKVEKAEKSTAGSVDPAMLRTASVRNRWKRED